MQFKRGQYSGDDLAPSKASEVRQPFLSNTWALLVIAFSTVLAIFAWVLHSSVGPQRPVLTQPVDASPGNAADVFGKCNAALPRSALSWADPDKALDGERCGQKEAAAIRAALDAKLYAARLVVPQQQLQSYPPDVRQAEALLGELLERDPDVATLIKFFAWGFPVDATALRTALGARAAEAAYMCNIVEACSALPSMRVSSVTLFPVPYTNAIVAADWDHAQQRGRREELVASVGLSTLALVHNIPPTEKLSVLDFSGGSGAPGIVAALRGARHVTYSDGNARALRFVRFSSWLNGVADVVETVEGKPTSGTAFDVLVARPAYEPLEKLLGGRQWQLDDGQDELEMAVDFAKEQLDPAGVFVMVAGFANPSTFAKRFCDETNLQGYAGSIVYEKPATSALDYALAHLRADVAHPAAAMEAAVKMAVRSSHVSEVSFGVIFGWHTADADKCSFTPIGVRDALQVQPDAAEARACVYGKHGVRSCPRLLELSGVLPGGFRRMH